MGTRRGGKGPSLVVAVLGLLNRLLRRRRRRRRVVAVRAHTPAEAGVVSSSAIWTGGKREVTTRHPFLRFVKLGMRQGDGRGASRDWRAGPHRPLLVLLGGVFGALAGVLLLGAHEAVLAL